MSNYTQGQYVETGVARLVFQSVATPQAPKDPNGKPKYSCCLLIPKHSATTEQRLKEAYDAAVAAGKARFGSSYRAKPFADAYRDGDKKDAEVLERCPFFRDVNYINAHSFYPPTIVNAAGQQLEEPETNLYDGCYVRAKLVAAPFVSPDNTNKGVTWYLQAVQKVRDGEKLYEGAGSIEFTPLTDEETDGDYLPF